MATTFFMDLIDTAGDTTPPGNLTADEDKPLNLGTRGAVAGVGTTSTVAGPTSGVQCRRGAALPIQNWYSEPIAAVTISGTVTFNVWMSENNMSANVGAQVIIDRCDGAGAFVSTVVNSESGVELPVGTRAAQNWTASPTSTSFASGDRIRVQIYGNDVGTMASGFTFNLAVGAASGGVDGDSFVTFTETISASGGAAATSFVIPHRHRGLIVR